MPQVKLDYYQGSSGTYAGLDRFGRVKDQYWEDYSGTPTAAVRIKHGYDYASNRTWREEVKGAASALDEFYTYDGLHRLNTMDRGNLDDPETNGITGDTTYMERWGEIVSNEFVLGLDALGNWSKYEWDDDGDGIGESEVKQTRGHNSVNEVTSITGGGWAAPAHDTAGNMTEGPQPGSEATEQQYVYDAWNRLVEVKIVTDPEPPKVVATVERYEYDGLGRRIVKETNYSGGSPQDTYDYYYNTSRQVLEVRKDASTNPFEQYVYDPYYIDAVAVRWWDKNDDGEFGTMATPDDDELQFFTHDANFNVTAVVEKDASTGTTVLERYIYSAYGKVKFLDSSFTALGTQETAIGNDILYTGRRLDPETGLYYYRARYYHAQLGRFVSRDPIAYDGSEWNLYEYVKSGPLMALDPNGRSTLYTPKQADYAFQYCKNSCLCLASDWLFGGFSMAGIDAKLMGIMTDAKEFADTYVFDSDVADKLEKHYGKYGDDVLNDQSMLPTTAFLGSALRHCVGAGVMAKEATCGCSRCLSDHREYYQMLDPNRNQSLAMTQATLANNYVGRDCAGCRGAIRNKNPSFGRHPLPVRRSKKRIEKCCVNALLDGRLAVPKNVPGGIARGVLEIPEYVEEELKKKAH